MIATPELSVLLIVESTASVLPAIRAYAAAGSPSRIELVLAGVGGVPHDLELATPFGFGAVRGVDAGDGDLPIAEARAARAATAPWVIFAQAHALPRPGFLEATLDTARAGGWTIVGPAFAEGRPDRLWSRVYNHVCNSRWMGDPPAGASPNVPGHNSVMLRASVMALDDRLDDLLEAGWGLVLALLDAGGRAAIEPRAVIDIAGPPTIAGVIRRIFRIGRFSAALRSTAWPRWRAWAYAAGSPLIPVVRAARIARDGRDHTRLDARLWPLVFGALCASAAGEAVGFVAGRGSRTRLELYRDVRP